MIPEVPRKPAYLAFNMLTYSGITINLMLQMLAFQR